MPGLDGAVISMGHPKVNVAKGQAYNSECKVLAKVNTRNVTPLPAVHRGLMAKGQE